MEFNVDEAKIMDYLYGNLSMEEQKLMEKAIEKDNQLKNEIEELSKVMGFMGKSEDKEVIPPAFVFPDEHQTSGSFLTSSTFKIIGSVAASLIILLVSAFVTGFHISKGEQGLMIGFHSNTPTQGVSKEEVRDIMQEVLTQYNQERDDKLLALESKLSSQLEETKDQDMVALKQYLSSSSAESRQMMKKYIDQSSTDNRQMIADYFQVSTDQQHEYLNKVLTDFSTFYNNQRKADLETIRTGLQEYKNSNDQKQYETEIVLANLADMVNTQNK